VYRSREFRNVWKIADRLNLLADALESQHTDS